MASPLDALQTRIGPAPAWVWIGGGGAGLYLLYRLGILGGGRAAQPGQTSVSGLAGTRRVSAISTGVPAPPSGPGPQPSPPPPLSSPPPPVPGSGTVTIRGPYAQVALWNSPTGEINLSGPNLATVVPSGTQLPSAGPPVPGQVLTIAERTSSLWQPVTFRGTTAYAWLPDTVLTSPTGAQGGAGRGLAARPSVTRRQDTHWSWHGHPDLKLEHVAPHFVVAGMGGAGLHPVAARAGIHPARLVALNPKAHPAPGRGGADDGMGGFTDAYAQPSYSFPRYGAQGGADDGMGGFTDAYAQPSYSFPRYGAQGGAQDQGGPLRRLRGRSEPTVARQGVGGQDDAMGGAQGATIPGSDLVHYRLPRVPLGHRVRAGELIRIR